MLTFREDPKLGSKVPMIKTADLNEQCVTNSKILDGCITKEKLAKGTVDSTTLANESVSAEKLQFGLRNTIASTYDKTIELDNQKANIADVGNAIERLENKIGERFIVEGDVTNLPDEEDLTSVSTIDGREVMKLNDRAYEPSNFSGKGYKILRKNIKKFDIPTVSIVVSYAPTSSGDISITVNDKVTTINLDSTTDTTPAIVATKVTAALKSSLDDYDVSISSNRIILTRHNGSSVSPSSINVGNTSAVISVTDSVNKNVRKNVLTDDMVSKPNTIYEIKYDFDLLGITINIPNNCILKFDGGSIKDGIIKGNNTSIIFSNACFKNITFDGSFKDIDLVSYSYFCEYKNDTELLKNIFYVTFNVEQETVLNLEPNKDYYIYGEAVRKEYYSLYEYNNVNNKTINGFNATIVDTRPQSEQNDLLNFTLRFNDCNNLKIVDLHYKNPNELTILDKEIGYQGSSWIFFHGKCDNIFVKTNIYNARHGISYGMYNNALENGEENGLSNSSFYVNAHKVGYAIRLDNSKNINVELYSDTFHRACYIMGIDGLNLKAKIKNLKVAPLACLFGDSLYLDRITKEVKCRGCSNVYCEIEDLGTTEKPANQNEIYCAGFSFYGIREVEADFRNREPQHWHNLRFHIKTNKNSLMGAFYNALNADIREELPYTIKDSFTNIAIVVQMQNPQINNYAIRLVASKYKIYEDVSIKINAGKIRIENNSNNVIKIKDSYIQELHGIGKIYAENSIVSSVTNTTNIPNPNINNINILNNSSKVNGKNFVNISTIPCKASDSFSKNITTGVFYDCINKTLNINEDDDTYIIPTNAKASKYINFIYIGKTIINSDILLKIVDVDFTNVKDAYFIPIHVYIGRYKDSIRHITLWVLKDSNIVFSKETLDNNLFYYKKTNSRFEVFVKNTALGYLEVVVTSMFDVINIQTSKETEINSIYAMNTTINIQDSTKCVNTGLSILDVDNPSIKKPFWWTGEKWVDSNGNPSAALKKGSTEQRPVGVFGGFYYFDTTINKPIWKKSDNENVWIDATGQEV